MFEHDLKYTVEPRSVVAAPIDKVVNEFRREFIGVAGVSHIEPPRLSDREGRHVVNRRKGGAGSDIVLTANWRESGKLAVVNGGGQGACREGDRGRRRDGGWRGGGSATRNLRGRVATSGRDAGRDDDFLPIRHNGKSEGRESADLAFFVGTRESASVESHTFGGRGELAQARRFRNGGRTQTASPRLSGRTGGLGAQHWAENPHQAGERTSR